MTAPEMHPITPLHGVAAHLDLLRRFLAVGEVDFLVGELGLYNGASRILRDSE
ncbi:hypothetical protein CK215_24610 [Mesorhizobium sp. WSM3864]|nr:hypothetical protein CK215_24610 [Mesorhizobium sp. WSM3864]